MILNVKFHEIPCISSRATLATKFLSHPEIVKSCLGYPKTCKSIENRKSKICTKPILSYTYIEESKKKIYFYMMQNKYQDFTKSLCNRMRAWNMSKKLLDILSTAISMRCVNLCWCVPPEAVIVCTSNAVLLRNDHLENIKSIAENLNLGKWKTLHLFLKEAKQFYVLQKMRTKLYKLNGICLFNDQNPRKYF